MKKPQKPATRMLYVEDAQVPCARACRQLEPTRARMRTAHTLNQHNMHSLRLEEAINSLKNQFKRVVH